MDPPRLRHKKLSRSRLVKVIVKEIIYKIDVNTLEQTTEVESLKLNEIARIQLKAAAPLVYDPFQENPSMGSAILISVDRKSVV